MDQQKKTSLIHAVRLSKKTSLPSLFAPSLPQHPSAAESSSHPSPPRSNPLVNLHGTSDALRQPSLLDNDPFANLASYAIPQLSDSPTSFEHPSPPPSTVVVSPQAYVYVPQRTVTRPRSSGPGQVRPAHTKPAFVLHPSLPSLRALAQMNMPTPGRKVPLGDSIKSYQG